MFERYTEKARRIIFFARHEASEFGSPSIESEHLLLGFLRECHTPLARSLNAESIRDQIGKRTEIRQKIATSVDLPISNEGRHILHYASEEADRLGHKHIGTEHLLIGLLLERDCYAAHLLIENGVSLEIARGSISEEPTRELTQPKSPGIPAGYRWKSLLYNPASETIVVEIARADTGHSPMSRLFMRHKDAGAYEQIGNPADDLSYEAPVCCEKEPIVIFNSTKWAGGGGNPDGVYAFNLRTKELTVCVAKDALTIREPHLRSWILTLVSLSDDGKTLYVKIGLEKPVSGGRIVEYYLASVALADNKPDLLSPLKDIRFESVEKSL